MLERCELCGARLKADDTACRECGTPRPASTPSAADASADAGPRAEPSMSFADIATPSQSVSAPQPVVPPQPSATAEPVSAPHSVVPPSESVSAPQPVVPPQPMVPQPVAAPSESVSAPQPVVPPQLDASPTAPEEQQLTSPELQFGEPAPSINFEDAGKSRAGLWVVVVLLLIGGGIAGWVVLSRDDAPPTTVAEADEGQPNTVTAPPPAQTEPAGTDDCSSLAPLAGDWNFATQVTGARSAKKLDINGHYKVSFEVEGCKVRASVAKIGFTGSTFPTRHIQRASKDLVVGDGAFDFGYGARFSLRDSRGKGVDQQFYFTVANDRLVGVWRQRGSEWEKNRLYGVLRGHRQTAAKELTPRMADLTCEARCSITCDSLVRGATADAEGIAACRGACDDAETPTPVCGDLGATSEEQTLALSGPEAELSTLCRKIKCDLDPKLRWGKAVSVTGNEGPIARAHLVHSTGKGEGRKGSLRLALRTEAGWHLSEAVAKLPVKGGTKEVDAVHVVATTLGSTGAAQTIVAEFAIGHRRSFVACRTAGDAPRCVVMRGMLGSTSAAALPGNTLTVRGPDGVTLRAW